MRAEDTKETVPQVRTIMQSGALTERTNYSGPAAAVMVQSACPAGCRRRMRFPRTKLLRRLFFSHHYVNRRVYVGESSGKSSEAATGRNISYFSNVS